MKPGDVWVSKLSHNGHLLQELSSGTLFLVIAIGGCSGVRRRDGLQHHIEFGAISFSSPHSMLDLLICKLAPEQDNMADSQYYLLAWVHKQ